MRSRSTRATETHAWCPRDERSLPVDGGANCHQFANERSVHMNACNNIVPGVFCGGEIEPGTFHGGEIEPGTFHGGLHFDWRTSPKSIPATPVRDEGATATPPVVPAPATELPVGSTGE